MSRGDDVGSTSRVAPHRNTSTGRVFSRMADGSVASFRFERPDGERRRAHAALPAVREHA